MASIFAYLLGVIAGLLILILNTLTSIENKLKKLLQKESEKE